MNWTPITTIAAVIAALTLLLAISLVFFGAVLGAAESLVLAWSAFAASIVAAISAYVVWRHLSESHRKAREDYLRHH